MAVSPADIRPVPARQPKLSGLTVFVRAIRLDAEIGVYAQEKGRTQTLVVDVELTLDPTPVGGITDTVNYETVVTKAKALVAAGHIDLVEHFAQDLAAALLENSRVMSARVRVEKPEALAAHAAAAGVEITAYRP